MAENYFGSHHKSNTNFNEFELTKSLLNNFNVSRFLMFDDFAFSIKKHPHHMIFESDQIVSCNPHKVFNQEDFTYLTT